MRRKCFETWEVGKMPDRSAEEGKEKRAEKANSHHMCDAQTCRAFNIPLK